MLLDEQALEEFRRPDGATVGDWHTEVGDAGLDVAHEAVDGTRQPGLEFGDPAVGQVAVGGLDARSKHDLIVNVDAP